MEDFLIWIFWALIIVGSIASSAAKAKKKREEEAKAQARGAEKKPAGGSFSRVLEELSRQLGEQPSPPVVQRPLSRPAAQPVPRTATRPAGQPEATSHDYYSLETEYDMLDGRGRREEYNAEDFDAIQRTRRTSLAPAAVVPAAVEAVTDPAATDLATAADSMDDSARNTLRGLLGGDFDLRRAVIEAEILTPKYI